MKRKILLISPTPSHPQTAGNRARVATLITSLKDLGHEVHFLHIECEKGSIEAMRKAWGSKFYPVDYTRPVNKIARLKRRFLGRLNTDARFTYGIDEWYDNSIDPFLKKLDGEHHFDTVIVEYVFFSKALECFGKDTLKIIDTHDAFANRHRHYLSNGQVPKWFSTTIREESKGFNRADIVIAIQDEEREVFSRQTRARVISVGHMLQLIETKPELVRKGRMLFVASDNTINVDGINFFINDVFPDVRNRVAAELVLVGSICDNVPDQPGLIKMGRVENLQAVYESAAVVINPVRFNTGLSIKNLEALGYSKPLVTSSVGSEGIGSGANSAYLVAENAQEFSSAVIKILTDENYAKQLASAAGQYAYDWNKTVIQQLVVALK